MTYLASKNKCVGCMACADICPKSAIKSYIDGFGHIYPHIDKNKCVDCKLCTTVCPILNKIEFTSELHKPQINAAWSLDDKLRKSSSSGGIFAELAKNVLAHGGVVFGATVSGFEVKHIEISEFDKLYLLQGSKYIQGDLSGVYKLVKSRLLEGRIVLFSGVPCQIQALKTFLKRDYVNLITVDLICGGFPSILPILKFAKEYPSIKGLRSFRDKDSGWKSKNYSYNLKVVDSNDKILEYGFINLPILAFGSSMTHRKSCLNCKFAKLRRFSDITIGDLWGDSKYKEQHENGLSVTICHTDKGKKILESSEVCLKSVELNEVVKYNFALINGKKYTQFHFSRILMFYLYKYKSYNFILNLYLGKGFYGTLYRIESYILRFFFNIRKKRILDGFLKNEG